MQSALNGAADTAVITKTGEKLLAVLTNKGLRDEALKLADKHHSKVAVVDFWAQ